MADGVVVFPHVMHGEVTGSDEFVCFGALGRVLFVVDQIADLLPVKGVSIESLFSCCVDSFYVLVESIPYTRCYRAILQYMR